MGALLTFLRKELIAAGVDVTVVDRVETNIQRNFQGSREYIGKPVGQAKRQILEFSSTVPSTFIARKLGVTVQHVRKVRRLLK